MSITFINSGSGSLFAGDSFDATGADLLVIAYCTTNETGPGGTRLGVAFNSIPMNLVQDHGGTLLGIGNDGGGGFEPSRAAAVYMYYLLNPPQGSFIVAPTGGASGGWVATAYAGVKQTVPDNIVLNSADPIANLALNLTALADNSLIVGVFQYADDPSFVAGLNLTTRVLDDTHSGGTFRQTIGDYIGVPAGATSINGSASLAAGRIYGIAALFAPVFISGIFFPML